MIPDDAGGCCKHFLLPPSFRKKISVYKEVYYTDKEAAAMWQ